MKIFREKHSFSTINCIGVKYCRWCLAVWKIPLYSQFVDLSWYYSTLLNFSDHYIDFFSFFISFICFYFTSTPIFFGIGFSFLHFYSGHPDQIEAFLPFWHWWPNASFCSALSSSLYVMFYVHSTINISWFFHSYAFILSLILYSA